MSEKNDAPIKGIVTALAVFQDVCPAIKKDSKAGQGNFTYKYGSLPMILEVIKPHLKKSKLVFTQPISFREGQEFIYTTLYHTESGEKIESKMLLPDIEFKGMNAIQSKGAIISYMRRYSLISILGIVPEEEDNDAQGETQKPQSEKPEDNRKWLNPESRGKPTEVWGEAVKYLAGDGKMVDIKKKYKLSKVNEERLQNEALTFNDIPGLNNTGISQSDAAEQSGQDLFPDENDGGQY